MVEIRDGKKVLVTPVSAEDLADIKIGDIVYLDGDLMTCRDVAHRRLVEGGRELPYDIRNKAIFHAGPIVRPIQGQDDAYEMVSVGPTTSMRMEKFEYEFTQHTGVRVIVGKGGMGPNTERACKEFGAIHCVFPAGCAVVAATEVQRIAEHHWDELGMPETLWCCKVKEFGPLIVSIDANGACWLIPSMKTPSRVFIFSDSICKTTEAGYENRGFFCIYRQIDPTQVDGAIYAGHSDRANFAFGDGHVEPQDKNMMAQQIFPIKYVKNSSLAILTLF